MLWLGVFMEELWQWLLVQGVLILLAAFFRLRRRHWIVALIFLLCALVSFWTANLVRTDVLRRTNQTHTQVEDDRHP